MEVLAEQPDGWSQVHVDDYIGYVKSEYLVDEQQAVTAESVDWSLVRALDGEAYAQASAVETAPVVHAAPAPCLNLAHRSARNALPSNRLAKRCFMYTD